MNRKHDRSPLRPRNASDDASDATAAIPKIPQPLPDSMQVIAGGQSGPGAANDGELGNVHGDPEDFGILLAACRIVASGYKAEISRGHNDSLFVQAAYQLLRHFLERQFTGSTRAA